ncbi:hypothetical protein RB653_001205 [Dictyostelium firmibasis]|uniref:Uncharacterized protein n=1 Tax=Dictyostelium firmibasis TaxID=79012 RepID=A0AAN7U7Z9_9MYCE
MIENEISNKYDSHNHELIIINQYYNQINPLLIKYDSILKSLDDHEDYDDNTIKNQHQQLNKEIIELIENKIGQQREREQILIEKKSNILIEIDKIIQSLDLTPDKFQIDKEIQSNYNTLIQSTLIKTPKLLKQINHLNNFYFDLKNIHNINENKLKEVYTELMKLYKELGIDLSDSKDTEYVSSSFIEMGIFVSNKRIDEIENEIKKLQDIRNSIMDKINDSKSITLNLKNELELNENDNNNNNNYISSMIELNEIVNKLKENECGGDSKKLEMKSLIQILYKFEGIIKVFEELKEKRLKQINNQINTIERDYQQLSIPLDDETRLKFKIKRDKLPPPSIPSLSLITLLTQESNHLTNLKKLKFKDSFQSKFKSLQSLWDQLCIPLDQRTLKNLLLDKIENNNNENDIDYTDETIYYNIETLEIIDKELKILNELLDSMKSILNKVKRREWIKSEMKNFETSASDPSRFKGSSIRLLEEAKFRKTIAREYPILTTDLVKELAEWEYQNQKSFLYFGNSYLELMNTEQERPDFHLLHLKLVTKKDPENLSDSPMVSYSSTSPTTTSPTTTSTTTTSTTNSTTNVQQQHQNIRPTTPTTPQRPTTPISKKPSPLTKKSSSFTPSTPKTTPPLSKASSSLNLSPTISNSSAKIPTLSKTMSSVNLTNKPTPPKKESPILLTPSKSKSSTISSSTNQTAKTVQSLSTNKK